MEAEVPGRLHRGRAGGHDALPPLLAEVAARIEDTDRVPAELSAGVLFAARPLADLHFDY